MVVTSRVGPMTLRLKERVNYFQNEPRITGVGGGWSMVFTGTLFSIHMYSGQMISRVFLSKAR